MFERVSDFLHRYHTLLSRSASDYERIIAILEVEIGKKISASDIRVRSGTLNIVGHPILKNAIWMKKERILKRFQDEGIRIINIA